MLNKIKQAQKDGRILFDIVVNYDNVVINNPINTIVDLYPQFKQVTNNNTISYKLESDVGNKIISISYVGDFKPDYYIVRLSTHDGTLLFTINLFKKVFEDIIKGLAYSKNNVPQDYSKDFWNYDIDYTIGNVYNFVDYGIKNINGHKIHGKDDVMVMPIKIEYYRNMNRRC